MKNKILISLLTFIIISVQAFAQSYVSDVSKKGTTAASFLSIPMGARAASVGTAFVSMADDPSSMYWNPAGLTKVKNIGVMFDHTKWFAGINFNYAALTFNAGEFGSIGLSFTSSDIGEMNVTTIDEPNGTGEVFKATNIAVALGYAISLTDNFSIGLSPKFVNESIWRDNAIGFAVDMGVQYVTPFDGAMLSMSITNFGSKLKMTGNTNLTLIQKGQNTKVPVEYQTDEWSMPLNFRVGVAYQPVKSEMHKWTVALDAQHPNDNYESINVGTEYVFNDFLALRGGYRDLFLKDPEFGLTAGFGLKQLVMGNISITFDYAFQELKHLQNVQKFSVGVNF